MYSFSGAKTDREVIQRLKSEFAFEVIDVLLKILVLQIHLKTIKILWKNKWYYWHKKKVLQSFETDDVLIFWSIFFTKRIILSITYLEERSTSFKMNYWYLWKIAEVLVHIGSAFKDCFTCIEYTC